MLRWDRQCHHRIPLLQDLQALVRYTLHSVRLNVLTDLCLGTVMRDHAYIVGGFAAWDNAAKHRIGRLVVIDLSLHLEN